MKPFYKIAFLILFGLTVFISSAYISCTSHAAPVAQSDYDAILYPQERWAPALLDMIKEGPRILPRDFNTQVPPPPANSSARTQYDLVTMRVYMGERTPDVLAQIKEENTADLVRLMLQPAIGRHLENYPQTAILFDIINHDVSYFVLHEKQHFQRARPSQLTEDLDPVIEVPHHASYPSGHATQTYAFALVLGMLDPAHADEYKAHSFAVARRREIAGVHYPSDSLAGFDLAHHVVEGLMITPRIEQQFAAAKDELSKAGVFGK